MFKLKILSLISFILLSTLCWSQTSQVYETWGTQGKYINGVFYKTKLSFASNNGGINFGLTAFDTSSTIIYQNNLGGTLEDRVFSIDLVKEKGSEYLLWGGLSRSFHIIPPNFGIGHSYLIKTNMQLDTIWTKLYDQSTTIRKIIPDIDSNYLAVMFSNHGQLVKINKLTGDTIWSNNIDFTTSGQANRMTFNGGLFVHADSCLFIGGIAYPVANAKIMLTKTDTIGNPIWMKAYGDTSSNWGWDGVMCHDNGFALVGQTGPDGGLNPDTLTYNDFLLVRTDKNGDTLWSKRYASNNGVDRAKHVLQTADLGFAILGTSDVNSTIDTIKTMLIKTDSLGNVQWVKSYREIANGGYDLYDFNLTDEDGFIWFDDRTVQVTDSMGNNCMAITETVTQTNAVIFTTDITNYFTYRGFAFPTVSHNTQEYLVNDTVSIACIYTSEEEIMEGTNNLFVYPNPNTGNFTLNVNSKSNSIFTLQLLNTLGQIVFTQETEFITGKNNITLATKKLDSGIYFLNIKGEEIFELQKILVQK